jgi:hypothetical protein
MKTKATRFELIIATVELKDRKPFGPRYAWQIGERDELYLKVGAHTIDGDAVVFDVVIGERCVNSCPGAAVVTYHCTNDPQFQHRNDWWTPGAGYCVTSGQQAEAQAHTFHVKPGDHLVVTGRIKGDFPQYKVINYVKFVSVA